MKTRTLFSIGIVFIIVGCADKTVIQDWLTQRNLVGHVKSVKEISYQAIEQSGNLIKGERKRTDDMDFSIIFDRKGKLIEENQYESDGSVWFRWMYTYNAQGKPIEFKAYKADGSLDEQWMYKYDENGRQIELNRYLAYNDGQNHKLIFKYDEKGKLIETKQYDSVGNLRGRITYRYDANSKVIERKDYDSDGKIARIQINRLVATG